MVFNKNIIERRRRYDFRHYLSIVHNFELIKTNDFQQNFTILLVKIIDFKNSSNQFQSDEI